MEDSVTDGEGAVYFVVDDYGYEGEYVREGVTRDKVSGLVGVNTCQVIRGVDVSKEFGV